MGIPRTRNKFATHFGALIFVGMIFTITVIAFLYLVEPSRLPTARNGMEHFNI
jgi:hypothetical protein